MRVGSRPLVGRKMIKMIRVRLKKTNNWLKDNGYSQEEECQIFEDQLNDILENVRGYLDSLEYLPTYRVSWQRYTGNKPGRTRATSPFRGQKE